MAYDIDFDADLDVIERANDRTHGDKDVTANGQTLASGLGPDAPANCDVDAIALLQHTSTRPWAANLVHTYAAVRLVLGRFTLPPRPTRHDYPPRREAFVEEPAMHREMFRL